LFSFPKSSSVSYKIAIKKGKTKIWEIKSYKATTHFNIIALKKEVKTTWEI
jgi:hypothetical protein